MENNLPKGWESIKVGELCNLVYGKGLLTKYLTETGYPVFGANGVIGKYKSYLYAEPKVIISCRGAASGAMHITVPKSFITSNSIILDTVTNEVSNEYLKYAMESVDRTKIVTGTAQPQITIENLKDLEIPLPPLPEQQRIVEKLDALMARISTSKTRLDKIPAVLKNFRQSVLAAAVSGELTKEWREENKHASWQLKPINEIGEVSGGVTLNSKRKSLNLQYPYLRVANVYANELWLDEIKMIGVLESEIKRTLLKKGDLLVVEGNGSIDQIGRVAIWNDEIKKCLHQNHLIKLRFNEFTTSKYVLYYLLSPLGREQIEAVSTSTSGLNTLSLSKISKLEIDLPPLEEQKEIVRKVEELFHFADSIEARYQKAKAWFDKLPQSILAKTFRGELVPQNEEDEPASELLKRIQNEKHTITKTPKPAALKTKAKKYRIDEDEGLSMVAEG